MSMFVFAAALAAAAPTPAAPVVPVAASEMRASDTAAIDPSTDTRRVCVVGKVTGSLLARKTCQTRAEWIKEGIDPLAQR